MADDSDPFPKLESVYRVKGSEAKQFSQNVVNIPEQTSDCKVNSWQSQNIPGGSAPRPWFPQNSSSNAWGHPKEIHKLADGTDPFPELVSMYRKKGSKINQLSQNVANIKWNPGQTGDSMVNSQQSQNIPGGSAPRHPNVIHTMAKRGSGVSGLAEGNRVKSTYPKNTSDSGKDALNDCNLSPQLVIPTTPKNISYSSVRFDTTPSKASKNVKYPGPCCTVDYEITEDKMVDSDSDILFDSDDDISLDDSDLLAIGKSHESRKKIKWFKDFFNRLDRLSNQEINTCKWHCPACKGGAGAIDWYRGKQPLMNHARTIQARRVRLHRLFAEILEEELRQRRASVTVASGTYGTWEGLHKQFEDFEIVWPPMVIIMNTRCEQDEKNKWIGMGNQELLDCFSSYAALKAQHSYGREGHKGMSVLIFESSAAGYFRAVCLHDHFKEHGRDREAWNHCRTPFVQDGKRQLFGFLASGKDLDFFNRHSTGKSRLKFKMRSYQEMFESEMKHKNNESKQLEYFKNMLAKEQSKSQSLAESLLKVTEKLRQTTEENSVVQQRTEVKSRGDSSKIKDAKHRLEDKKVRQFEAERDELKKIREDVKLPVKKKQWQEEAKLMYKLTNERNQLKNKCTPAPGQSSEESG